MAVAELKRNLSRFAQAFNTETRLAVRSRTIHWLGWMWPLLLFVLINGIYKEGTLQDMPVGVVDADNSVLSRQLMREFDAGSHAELIPLEDDLQSGLRQIQDGDQYALLYIPRHFESDVLAGKQPKAVLYYNALFYSAGFYSTQDFPGLIAALNTSLRGDIAAGMNMPVPPLASINLSFENLFNASGNYVYYQQFAAMVHLLQLFVIVTMVHVLAREAPELRSTSPHILRARALGVRLMGKLAPYTLLFTALLMLQVFLIVVLHGARINGSVVWMLAISVCYVIAAQSVGMVLFVFTANRFTAYSLIGMLIGVAQTYSGVLLPELAMPGIARVIGLLEPLTHAIHGLFDQFLRHAPTFSGLEACAKLTVYPLVAYLLSRQRLRIRLDISPT